MLYPRVDFRSIPLFSGVSDAEWNDWSWQIRNGIRDVETLEKVVKLTDREREEIRQCLGKFTMEITPYYAALMDPDDPFCPVRMQSVPRIAEMHDDPSDMHDPLHEDVDSPVPGLTHRYPDRVLLLVTNICSMNCRHCTRRRLVGDTDVDMPEDNVAAAIEYIRSTPTVRDVLLSGGDPFVLPDARLRSILERLRAIPHVEMIRIGTRTTVVMPQRITDDLVDMLKQREVRLKRASDLFYPSFAMLSLSFAHTEENSSSFAFSFSMTSAGAFETKLSLPSFACTRARSPSALVSSLVRRAFSASKSMSPFMGR